MTAVSWYGPLMDLAAATAHIGDFVQLLVFVHRSTPVQYKVSRGERTNTVTRTEIQVGDETRSFFSVSLWGKNLAALVSAGDVALLQNVKVTTFANVIEAKTVHCSSVLPLVHMNEKGVDHLADGRRFGKAVKDKLKKVIEWVLKSGCALHVGSNGHQTQAPRNWRIQETQIPRKSCTLSEVLHLASSCSTIFRASIGEIFLPSAWHESEMERMFISKRLIDGRDSLVEDMIYIGCQLCGSPFGLENGPDQRGGQLFCEKSSNHSHSVGSIYRPFMVCSRMSSLVPGADVRSASCCSCTCGMTRNTFPFWSRTKLQKSCLQISKQRKYCSHSTHTSIVRAAMSISMLMPITRSRLLSKNP